jgi:sulfopyruvate decarboxylase TPP-binding subunit
MPDSLDRSTKTTPEAEAFAAFLAGLGVTHVVTIPDNTSAPLLDSLRFEGGVDLHFGTREGEVISMAAGLWLGGGAPAVIIQNTGLLESGDALRGTASRMGAPLLLVVTCRGYAKSRALGHEPHEVEVNRETLVRPDLDSVAHMTESTLEAWGVPFVHLRDPADLSPLREGWARAHEEERPVAVLVDASFG